MTYNPDEPNGENPGIAHIYTRVGTSWTLAKTIPNPSGDTDGEHFGEAVALYGRWAAIAAPQEDPNDTTNAGVVYMYKADEEDVYQK